MRVRDYPADEQVALFDRPGAQGQHLRAIQKLDKILQEDENAEGGDKENKVMGFVFSKRRINKFINSHTNKTDQNRRNQKAEYRMKTELYSKGITKICSTGVNHTMREMKEFNGAVDDGKSDRNKSVNRPRDEAIDKKLGKQLLIFLITAHENFENSFKFYPPCWEVGKDHLKIGFKSNSCNRLL